MPCNTKEADECLLLHTLDILKRFDRILIKTNDSDIVIIMTAVFRIIPSIKELCIINFILVHETASHLA